jgi:FkbM family methyltransferase
MNLKPLMRFFYAWIPGLATARFKAMELTAGHIFKPEYRGVLKIPVANGLIIDVGANRGQGIAAFKKLVPQSNIIAFEPEPRLAERLALRYRRDPSVTVNRCALGAHSGTVTFFVPTYGRWNCDGMSATDYKAATEWLRDPGRMFRFDKAKLSVSEHLIECKTLDSYKLSPALVKLHAQGAELEILSGSKETIRKHRPALMCAFPTTALTEMLADWGYRAYAYCDGRFVPRTGKRHVTFTWYLTDDQARQVF